MRPGQLDLPAVPLLLEASEAEVREECQQSSVTSGLCPVNTRHTETRDPAITPITLPLIITYINHKLGWLEYKEALQNFVDGCCSTNKLVTRQCRGPGGDGPGVIMRTKLYNLLKAVSQARLTSAGPEQVCPGSGSGHILEIQQESEPTFIPNCVYTDCTMVQIIQRYTHTTLQHINTQVPLSRE